MVSTSWMKISILCFYRRFTSEFVSKRFLYWVRGSILYVVCCCITFVTLFVFTCLPVEAYWRIFDYAWRMRHEFKCIDEGAAVIAGCIVSLVQDIYVCALPVFLVWSLQMPKRQKAALIGIFVLGVL
jgi:hypothetical protein